MPLLVLVEVWNVLNLHYRGVRAASSGLRREGTAQNCFKGSTSRELPPLTLSPGRQFTCFHFQSAGRLTDEEKTN